MRPSSRAQLVSQDFSGPGPLQSGAGAAVFRHYHTFALSFHLLLISPRPPLSLDTCQALLPLLSPNFSQKLTSPRPTHEKHLGVTHERESNQR